MTYADFSAATAADDWDGAARPIDILYANAPTAAEGVPVTESQKMWLRIRDAVSANPVVHLAGLAYLSDATLIDHALLPHGHRWHDDRLVGASLDHTMYFHRPAECDEWLLYDQTVEFTGGSRGVASGTLYRRDGTIVATTLQEGLIRWSE